MIIFFLVLFPMIFFINIFCISKILYYYKPWNFSQCGLVAFLIYLIYLIFIGIIFLIIPNATIEIFSYTLLSFQIIAVLFYLFYINIILQFNYHIINAKNITLFSIFFACFMLIDSMYITYNFSQDFINNPIVELLNKNPYEVLANRSMQLNSVNLIRLFTYEIIKTQSELELFAHYSFVVILSGSFALLFTIIYNQSNQKKFEWSDLLRIFYFLIFALAISTLSFSLTNNTFNASAWVIFYFLLLIYGLNLLKSDNKNKRELGFYVLTTSILSSYFFVSWFFFISWIIFLIFIVCTKQLAKRNIFRTTIFLFIYVIFNTIFAIMNLNYMSIDISTFVLVVGIIFILFFSFNKNWIQYSLRFEISYLKNINYLFIFILAIYFSVIILFYIFYSLKLGNFKFRTFMLTSLFIKSLNYKPLSFWTLNILFWAFSYVIEIIFAIFGYYLVKKKKYSKELYFIIIFSLLLLWNPFIVNCLIQVSEILSSKIDIGNFESPWLFFMCFVWIIYFLLSDSLSYKIKRNNNKNYNEQIRQRL